MEDMKNQMEGLNKAQKAIVDEYEDHLSKLRAEVSLHTLAASKNSSSKRNPCSLSLVRPVRWLVRQWQQWKILGKSWLKANEYEDHLSKLRAEVSSRTLAASKNSSSKRNPCSLSLVRPVRWLVRQWQQWTILGKSWLKANEYEDHLSKLRAEVSSRTLPASKNSSSKWNPCSLSLVRPVRWLVRQWQQWTILLWILM